MNTNGNQAAPTQVQTAGPASAYINSNDCDTLGSYMFYFGKGSNKVTLESTQSALGISEIALVPASEILPYAEYLDMCQKELDADPDSRQTFPPQRSAWCTPLQEHPAYERHM